MYDFPYFRLIQELLSPLDHFPNIRLNMYDLPYFRLIQELLSPLARLHFGSTSRGQLVSLIFKSDGAPKNLRTLSRKMYFSFVLRSRAGITCAFRPNRLLTGCPLGRGPDPHCDRG